MGEMRKPDDCKHYLACEHLNALFSEHLKDKSSPNTLVLPKDAEPICRQCKDFEAKGGAE